MRSVRPAAFPMSYRTTGCLYNDGVTWPSTFLLAPNMLYRQYGDARVIEKHYPALRQWEKYMEKFLDNGLMPKNTYGDWCVPPESPELIHSKDPARVTDPTLISTAYFYRMLQVMSDDAKLAGKPADAAEYDALAARVKDGVYQALLQTRHQPVR